jgi:hypothetical protein
VTAQAPANQPLATRFTTLPMAPRLENTPLFEALQFRTLSSILSFSLDSSSDIAAAATETSVHHFVFCVQWA